MAAEGWIPCLHFVDVFWRPAIAARVRECVPLSLSTGCIRYGTAAARCRRTLLGYMASGLLVQLYERELGPSIDCHKQVELALLGSHLSQINVEVADRISLRTSPGKVTISRSTAASWRAAPVTAQLRMKPKVRSITTCVLSPKTAIGSSGTERSRIGIAQPADLHRPACIGALPYLARLSSSLICAFSARVLRCRGAAAGWHRRSARPWSANCSPGADDRTPRTASRSSRAREPLAKQPDRVLVRRAIV